MTDDPSLRERVRATLHEDRYRVGALALALFAGLVVFTIAHELFPYHSSNHDEGVYLQQAAMLLEGRLFLTPSSEALREAFHPWFFVESERGLYAKYTPVTAAVFALGKLAGGYRLALFAVAAGNVALVAALVAEAFDRRTGLLAAATMLGAPLFLLTSSVFLPYAPTLLFNLLFALAYVRAVRRESTRYAALAGVAVGLAFFARPYTAVLFAAPFVAHACWRLVRAIPDDRAAVARLLVVAGGGLAFVGLALAYNWHMTGSPFVFPYQAFAPLDGLGFGRRRILGHELVYTPELALRANALVVRAFLSQWFTAGLLGTALALGGVLAAGLGVRRDGLDVRGPDADPLSDRLLQVLLFGIALSVVVGNLYFWGNVNVLGRMDVPDDGLVSVFGPFYHFDLLLPLSAFAAHGVLVGAAWLHSRAREHATARTVKVGFALLLVVSVPVVGAAEASVLGPPVEKNAAYTAKFEQAYEPFERAEFDGALVFVPPEYGEWRNHPFQWLRNDPGFDGRAVYAISRNPTDDFAVLDAYPDRSYYRYRYHGEWTPDPTDHVVPLLERVERREATELRARTTVSVPDRVVGASVTISNGEAVRRYDYEGDPPDALAVTWTLSPSGATVDGANLTARESDDPVPIDGPETVALLVTIREPSGATLTYREEVLVRPTETGVEAVWPPATTVCTLVTECGLAGTYIPDRPDTRPRGTDTTTTLVG